MPKTKVRKKRKAKRRRTTDAILDALALARTRVGTYPAKRLRWLLKFAYLDWDSLGADRAGDLRWEVAEFGLNKKPAQLRHGPDMDIALVGLSYAPHGATAETDKGASPALIRQFQATMRAAFEILFLGQQWRVVRPTYEERIALFIKAKDGSYWADNPPPFTGHDFLLMQAIDLIKTEKERLKLCQNPRCATKRFVAEKKGRAFFCSPRCSAWVRVNKARGKFAEGV